MPMSATFVGCVEPKVNFFDQERLLIMQNSKIAKHKTKMIPS